jgi:hypothetical protein
MKSAMDREELDRLYQKLKSKHDALLVKVARIEAELAVDLASRNKLKCGQEFGVPTGVLTRNTVSIANFESCSSPDIGPTDTERFMKKGLRSVKRGRIVSLSEHNCGQSAICIAAKFTYSD